MLVLGPVAVVDGDGRPEPRRGQQGQVLALLAAHHPAPVSAETLIDELWPERVPPTARTGLRVVMTRLRERFPGPTSPVVHEAASYRLNLAPEAVDRIRFSAALDQARRQLPTAPGIAAELLTRALGWWRGDAYQPYASSDRLSLHATHLDQQRREAEELLLDALLRADQADNAASWATAFAAAEPYRERRWELLMLALYRTGRQAEALRAAQRAGDVLREDLGLDPGPGLRQLEADILAHAPHLDLTPPPRPLPAGGGLAGQGGVGEGRLSEGLAGARPPNGGPRREWCRSRGTGWWGGDGRKASWRRWWNGPGW